MRESLITVCVYIFVRHKLFPFYIIVFCSYIIYCVYSFMFYLFFVCNVFHSESKWNWKWNGTWKWKYYTHNCATSAHQAWAAITHQEIAQQKGCYFGRHSKSTPKCATSAHRFLQCSYSTLYTHVCSDCSALYKCPLSCPGLQNM